MSQTVNVLLVEDSIPSAAAITQALRTHELTPLVSRVQSRRELEAALAEPRFDVALCDNQLPDMDAEIALGLIRERCADLPCIVVTGTVGEESAAACMRAGACDLVLKTNLSRLGAAVERAIATVHERRARERAERDSLRSESRLRHLADSFPDVYWVIAPDSGRFVYVSPAFEKIWGRSPAELLERPQLWLDSIHPQDRERVGEVLGRRIASSAFAEEYRIIRPDGSIRWIYDRSFLLRPGSGAVDGLAGIAADVTERRKASTLVAARSAVSRIIADNQPVEQTIGLVLAALVESLGWDYAAFWQIDPSAQALRCTQSAQSPADPCPRFDADTHARSFEIDVGLPGELWRSGKPVWVPDVREEPRFLRAASALEDRLRAVCMVPVFIDAQLAGHLELFSRERSDLDSNLLEALAEMAGKLGQFVVRRHALEVVQRSQRHLADFVENSALGIQWIGHDGRVIWANRSQLELVGLPAERYVGHALGEFLDDARLVDKLLEATCCGGRVKDLATRMIAFDGTPRDVIISADQLFEDGEFVHLRCYMLDISEQRRAEQRLEMQRAVAVTLARTPEVDRALADVLEVLCTALGWELGAVWTPGPGDGWLKCDQVWTRPGIRAERFVELTQSSRFPRGVGLPGRVWLTGLSTCVPDVTQDDNFPRADAAREDGLHGAAAFPILLAGRVIGVLEFFSTMIRPPDAALAAVLQSIGSQIGQAIERRRAQEALARREAELEHRALESAVIASTLSTFLSSGQVRPAAARLLRGALELTGSAFGFFGTVTTDGRLRVLAVEGFSWDERGAGFFRRMADQLGEVGYLDLPELDNLFGWVIRSGRPLLTNEPDRDPRYGGRAPAGHPALSAFVGVPILGQHGPIGMIGVANRPNGYAADELARLESLAQLAGVFCESHLGQERRRALEDQLRQSQKMEAFGQLAGGVAHDFNNLLTVISGYADTMLEDLREADPLRESVTPIRRAARRAHALTKQLLAFSRCQVLQTRVFAVNDVIQDLEKMLVRLIGEDIHLRAELARGLSNIKADPGQLEQVIMNLVLNARDALPRGGNIAIRTRAVELDSSFCASHVGARPGAHVEVSVIDDGHGMTPEVQARIFEPFFTTKETGEGTGLGLATVYGIVEQGGGHITVQSAPGAGTTFRVFLPCCADAVAPAPRMTAPVSRGHETILVVEDDPEVRGLAVRFLERSGFRPIAASSADSALEHLERQAGIDLVLSDVVMPGTSGPGLKQVIAQRWQHIRTLLMSGYTADLVARRGVMEDGEALLDKPFSCAELVRAVREALDRRPPPQLTSHVTGSRSD